MGNLGVRQTLTGYELLLSVQIRALCKAVKEKGEVYKPCILIPLLIDAGELKKIKQMIYDIAGQEDIDASQQFFLGAIIETPRAVLQADAIAEIADLIVFDTIGLTESVLATTADDAGSFIPVFLDEGVYPADPFEILAQNNVGKFIGIAVARARSVRPGLPMYYFGNPVPFEQTARTAPVDITGALAIDQSK